MYLNCILLLLSVKTDDYFDARVMETVRHRLIEFGERTQSDLDGQTPNTATFHSTVSTTYNLLSYIVIAYLLHCVTGSELRLRVKYSCI